MDSDIDKPPSLLASIYTSPFAFSLISPQPHSATVRLALVCPCVATEQETC